MVWELIFLLLNNSHCWWKSIHVTQVGLFMEEVVSQNFIPSAKVMFSPVSGIVGLSAGLQNKIKTTEAISRKRGCWIGLSQDWTRLTLGVDPGIYFILFLKTLRFSSIFC